MIQNPPTAALVAPWEAWAIRLGDALAIQELGPQGQRWSWARLAEEARTRAHRWRRGGLGPGDRVCLAQAAGADWVASVWAAWSLGAVWCPLPPGLPDPVRATRLAHLDPRLTVGTGPSGDVWRTPDLRPCSPEAAYLIHTSGSTGAPKGVLVGVAGLTTLWSEQARAFGTHVGTRTAWMLSPAFDASVSDIGVALSSGASLTVVPAGHWRRYAPWCADMAEHGIQQLDAPPSWLALWAERPIPPSLETVIAGGEATPEALLRAWSPHLRWINVYGPTEATVCTSLERRHVGPAAAASASLGQPLPGIAYRLQAPGRAQPDGPEPESGELWIGGNAVALGYWRDPEQTRVRFADLEGQRWFRTGDAVRRSGGQWIFEGRLDRQVKRRGQLLHLEGVEAALVRCPGIAQAVAFLDARDRLCVAIEARDVSGSAEADWRAHAAAHLPAWGVPQRWFRRTDWPFTATGKIDRRRVASEAGGGL